jgi:putative hydrolase of the HAD superfamily
MNRIKAIGFDLFNTLITLAPEALKEALGSLIGSLESSGFVLDRESFKHDYVKAANRFLEQSQKDGRETHNRFWISAALSAQGYPVAPNDPRVSGAVEAYFSVFPERCRLIPKTSEMLTSLQGSFRLGLLSNFTHAPAAWQVIDALGLRSYFDVVLISGELGYRKPHPMVFEKLIESLGVQREETIYIGDDPEADIRGAQQAGLQAIWATCVRDQGLPAELGMFSQGMGTPSVDVSRISTWESLGSMLGHGSYDDSQP